MLHLALSLHNKQALCQRTRVSCVCSGLDSACTPLFYCAAGSTAPVLERSRAATCIWCRAHATDPVIDLCAQCEFIFVVIVMWLQ